MEHEEKVQLGMLLFLSTLLSDALLYPTYNTGLGQTLGDLKPIIQLILLILLGLALILIALDFIAAGVAPDSVISLVTWIYVLILGILVFLMAILNFLKV